LIFAFREKKKENIKVKNEIEKFGNFFFSLFLSKKQKSKIVMMKKKFFKQGKFFHEKIFYFCKVFLIFAFREKKREKK
jgi:hypothetical protein